MRFVELPEPTKRLLFLGTIVVGVITFICVVVSNLADLSQPSSPTTTHTPTPAPTRMANVSPLLFGTNLDFSTSTKQRAQPSTQVTDVLQNMHLQIIRISFAENPSQTDIKTMALYVQNLKAVPLVPLHGSLYPHAQADNTLVVQTMNQVFGNTTVYYEYGDEEDALGISADQYTSAWNANIPPLKRLAPNGHFIGPVTYHYDQEYLRSFLRNARPLPDEISWHEFTCDGTWSKQQCMDGISAWNTHIAAARTMMKTLLQTTLPIMITEWNYAANAQNSDGKGSDSTFLTTWTKNAMHTLATNQVFASMQYSGTKSSTPTVTSNDQIMVQGQVMRSLYEQYFSKTAPPGSNSTPTPTPTATSEPTDTPTPTPTPTPEATDNGGDTDTPVIPPTIPTPTPAPVVLPTPTHAPTPTPTPTHAPTPTPTPVAAPVPTPLVTPTPTDGTVPTPTPTPAATPTIEATPTDPTPTETMPDPTPSPTAETPEPTPTPTVMEPTPTPIPTATSVPPTPTPTPVKPTPTQVKPTATPTPKPCTTGTVSSNPIYHGNGYASSNGGTYRTVSGNCGGKVYFAFSSAPSVKNTQVRLCTASGTCGSWVKYTSVGSKLLIKSGLSAGTSFHLQFQGYGATASYKVYGNIYY
jgi:hypothetical protein